MTTEAVAVEIADSAGDVNRWLSGLLERLPFISAPASPAPENTAPMVPPSDTEPPLDSYIVDTFLPRYDYLVPTLSGQGGESPGPPPGGSWLSPVFFSARMRPPVTGPVTSAFGWRVHPITEAADFHRGIDIAAPEGRAILAALPGEVIEVGYSRIYGNFIMLAHSANLRTSYSHCSEIIAREGMMIRQGERIAKVGSTGVATGPHLHFAVIAHDRYVNPYWALSDFVVVER